MRVFYLIDSLTPGGAEVSLASLAPHYVRRGVELHVGYLYDRVGVQDELLRAGASIEFLGDPRGRLATVSRVRRAVARRRPDVLHTTLFEADVSGRAAAVRLGVPVVCSLVNDSYGPRHRADPLLRSSKVLTAQLLDAATARFVARFHALSHYVAAVMSERLRVARRRIDVIPRGRDAAALGARTRARRDGVRRSLGLEEGTPLVLSAARHEHQKGLDLLLAAFSEVIRRDGRARLVIAGREGAASALLEAQAKASGLDGYVRFLGPRRDVPDLLCAADVFVLPSRWEGFAGVLVEAMALEAPIVASNLPAVRETLDHGVTALLVDPWDAGFLAQAIVDCLSDRSAAGRRAAAARSVFDSRLTSDHVASEMIEFYERVLRR